MEESYLNAVNGLSPELVSRLEEAIATGRWPNGDKVTEAQLENAMQAVMSWRSMHAESDNQGPFTLNKDGDLLLGKGKKYQHQNNNNNDEERIDVRTSTD